MLRLLASEMNCTPLLRSYVRKGSSSKDKPSEEVMREKADLPTEKKVYNPVTGNRYPVRTELPNKRRNIRKGG